jgi:hypothetical protein
MRPIFEDQLTEELDRRPDGDRFLHDPLDRPILMTAVAGGHVVGDGGIVTLIGRGRI